MGIAYLVIWKLTTIVEDLRNCLIGEYKDEKNNKDRVGIIRSGVTVLIKTSSIKHFNYIYRNYLLVSYIYIYIHVLKNYSFTHIHIPYEILYCVSFKVSNFS